MAEVNFAADDKIDARLEAVAKTTAGDENRPLRVRVQPDFYDYTKKAYTSWSGLAWSLDMDDIAEARRLREGLTNFFRVFGSSEIHQKQMLIELERRVLGSKVDVTPVDMGPTVSELLPPRDESNG